MTTIVPSGASIEHIITEIVASDTALQARIRRLVESLLSEAETTMRYGTPATKGVLMRSVVPALIRTLGQDKADDELADLRAAFIELRAEVRDHTPTTPVTVFDTRDDTPDR